MNNQANNKPKSNTLLCGLLVINCNDNKLYKVEYILKNGLIGIRRCFKNGIIKKTAIFCETTINKLNVYYT